MKLEKDDCIFILKWLAYWLGVLGFYLLVFIRYGVTYLSSSFIISSYYLFFSVVGIYIFSKDRPYKKLFNSISLILLGVVAGEVLGNSLNPLSSLQLKSLIEYHFYYPLFEMSSSFSKLFEVLFQQTMICLLVNHLLNRTLDKKGTMNYFTLVFVILHLPLLVIFSHIGLVFIIPSFFAGYIFSYLILNFEKGYLLSFLVHLLFYIGLAVCTRLSGVTVYDLLSWQ